LLAVAAIANPLVDFDGISAPAESTGGSMIATSADAAIVDWLPHDRRKPMHVMLPPTEALH
jgi:hypothetical protein